MKKLYGMCALCALLTLFIAACANGGSTGATGGTGATSTAGTSSNTVGLTSTNFAQSSITIKKGDSITLANQANVVHIISNGTWKDNTPDPKTETGAPVVSSKTISSANQTLEIGPFNTAGTFHYYCSVHPGMNLAVTVQ